LAKAEKKLTTGRLGGDAGTYLFVWEYVADTNAREIAKAPGFDVVVCDLGEVVPSLLGRRQSSQLWYRKEFQDLRQRQREQTDTGIFVIRNWHRPVEAIKQLNSGIVFNFCAVRNTLIYALEYGRVLILRENASKFIRE
jgi:hypothetical protein